MDGQARGNIVRVPGNEGPMAGEESEAFAALKNTGLVNAALRCLPGQG